MSRDLAATVRQRMKAGALVVIVQEADEQLAVSAVEAGCSVFGPSGDACCRPRTTRPRRSASR